MTFTVSVMRARVALWWLAWRPGGAGAQGMSAADVVTAAPVAEPKRAPRPLKDRVVWRLAGPALAREALRELVRRAAREGARRFVLSRVEVVGVEL